MYHGGSINGVDLGGGGGEGRKSSCRACISRFGLTMGEVHKI